MRSLLLTAAGLLVALTTMAAAQADYPNQPVRLIIPFPPGGSNDVVGRVIAQHLGEVLGKQVIVDNRGGAGGVIGTEPRRSRSRTATPSWASRWRMPSIPWLYKLPYDPIKAFAPIGIMGKGPDILSVNPKPAGPFGEGADRAWPSAKPGDLQYASAGVGSFQHLGAELFKLDGRRRHPARAVQGRRPGDDGRDGRPHHA